MKRALSIMAAALLLGGVLPGCVDEPPELTAQEREQLRDHILSEAPSPQHELDIQFENRARLVGYDIDVETITPGQEFHITWYWQCQRALGDGWQLFTHVADSRGENRLNQDSEGLVRQMYQPFRWRQGEYVRDVQAVTIPTDWGSDRAVFYLGFWRESSRLSVTRGPNDGDSRARAVSIPVAAVESSATPQPTPEREVPPPPSIQAARADGIQLDGRLDEAAWQATATTGPFVNTLSGGAGVFPATARVLWDDSNLYVGFDVTDTLLRSSFTERDGHLWEQDAVEIMVDPDGDGRSYFEMQVAPTAQVFDTHYDTRRQPQPFGHVEWNSGLTARVATRGTPNDDAADEGYSVEIAIPWSGFHHGEGEAPSAPPAGSTWRMNLYVMDVGQGEGQRAVGWSPTREGDFHVPARFGRVTFQAPAVVAAAEPGTAVAVPQLRIPPEIARRLRPDPQALRPGMRFPEVDVEQAPPQ